MKNNFPAVLLAAILVLSGACTKNFLRDNTNPNGATNLQLTYDFQNVGGDIKQMEQEIVPLLKNSNNTDLNNYQLIYNLSGDNFSGQQGASDAFGNNNVNNNTYSLIPGWYSENFYNAYLNEMGPWYDCRTKTAISSPSTYALSQIIKVLAMQKVTDCYGPIPYTGYQAGALAQPYDAQQTVYTTFFSELDSAITTLTAFVQGNPGAKPLAQYDIIYGGGFTEWLKLANSLKLRLALRVVYVPGVTFGGKTSRQLAEEAVQSGTMTGNGDNAEITVDGSSTWNPLNQTCYSYNDTRMGATMESFLRGYNDPRAPLLFNKVSLPANSAADYHGIRTGSIIVTATYQGFSTMNITVTTPVQIMAAAETYFLKAEGALRGWNMGGTAQSLYETGIKTAFSQPIGGSQQAAGDATGYIANATSKPAPYTDPANNANDISEGDPNLSTVTIAWNGSAPFETNLERILTQKWIALYPDGLEAWAEFRRTGYPKVFPIPAANNNSNGTINTQTQIRRLPFAQNEYISNAAGVQQGLTQLGGPDVGGTKLWWDKNPNH